MTQPDPEDAERRSHLERAAGLRALAAETRDATQQDLLQLLAESYEGLAERAAPRTTDAAKPYPPGDGAKPQ
jgi:hypothetical protein